MRIYESHALRLCLITGRSVIQRSAHDVDAFLEALLSVVIASLCVLHEASLRSGEEL